MKIALINENSQAPKKQPYIRDAQGCRGAAGAQLLQLRQYSAEDPTSGPMSRAAYWPRSFLTAGQPTS
jgi:hypothetical protein